MVWTALFKNNTALTFSTRYNDVKEAKEAAEREATRKANEENDRKAKEAAEHAARLEAERKAVDAARKANITDPLVRVRSRTEVPQFRPRLRQRVLIHVFVFPHGF